MNRARTGRLGILGWAYAGRFGVERYAYLLHRITGLGILAYFLLHVFVTSSRALGQGAWESVMGFLNKPVFRFGEFLVYVAFAYHALNGVRLILGELGFTLGRPGRPVYPYPVAHRRQRPLFLALMILSAALIVAGGWDFFVLGH
ncbi:MAG: succinate dehydrogenase, cytochrome b556 subunit [candidate division KSB1 bacterium]|nr:succinate dehydrogenase, cytochrome b556 subunit [candidate division KSB1 bacterium]